MTRTDKYVRIDSKAKKILSIAFHNELDTDPDLSYLGEYKNYPGDDDVTVDRKARNDWSSREYQFFIAAMSAEASGNPESVEQDYARMEAYNGGQWHMTYLYAEARVSINGVIQTIRSGGLSGVESDSEPSYFEEIKKDELADLKDTLEDIGFSKSQIRTAFKDA